MIYIRSNVKSILNYLPFDKGSLVMRMRLMNSFFNSGGLVEALYINV